MHESKCWSIEIRRKVPLGGRGWVWDKFWANTYIHNHPNSPRLNLLKYSIVGLIRFLKIKNFLLISNAPIKLKIFMNIKHCSPSIFWEYFITTVCFAYSKLANKFLFKKMTNMIYFKGKNTSSSAEGQLFRLFTQKQVC